MSSRITSEYAEAFGDEDPDVRITQAIVEGIGVGTQPAATTYARIEAFGTGLQPPYITQQYIEIFGPNEVPSTEATEDFGAGAFVLGKAAHPFGAGAAIFTDVATPVFFWLTLEKTPTGASYVKAIVGLAAITSETPIAQLVLYKAPTMMGPWKEVTKSGIPAISTYINMYDTNTLFGIETFYRITALNSAGAQSPPTAAKNITPEASAAGGNT